MAAIGSYVTLSSAKLRLLDAGVADSSNDALITALCAEVNQFIESRTGRVLAPVPVYSTTATGTAGASQLTVASAAGIAVGDDLLIGPTTGAHEDAEVLAISGTTLYLTAPLLDDHAADPLQRIYVQDGHDALDSGRRFIVPRGIIALAALEVAPYTGGPWALGSPTDWFLRPSGPDLEPGWPYTEIVWTDIPTGSSYPVFYPGYDNIRLIGPGPCVADGMAAAPFLGWPAVPDDVRGVAENLFLAAFRARASSGGDSFSVTLDGTRTYERSMSYEDRKTLERYRAKGAQAV